MKILIAADKFKDALDSFAVGMAIEKGINAADKSIETKVFPLADGGEGTQRILRHHLGGVVKTVDVHDPIFRKITAEYFITQDGSTAYIEMANASGLSLLSFDERNPIFTTTYGVGELINDAITQKAKKIVLGIGGSATNDGGIGMATALGFKFYDKNGQILSGVGHDLPLIEKMVVEESILNRLSAIDFSVICDVSNPLYGKDGAAFVYAKQKGANDDEVDYLDKGLKNLAKKTNKEDLAFSGGAGAAGGLGFGCIAFLNGTLFRGIDLVMKLTGFDEEVKAADIIITGEGKLDYQTSKGKLVQGVVSVAAHHHKPIIALCGMLELSHDEIRKMGLTAAFTITSTPKSLQDALLDTAKDLESTAYNFTKSKMLY